LVPVHNEFDVRVDGHIFHGFDEWLAVMNCHHERNEDSVVDVE
jgi:hypothetical protein